MDRASTIVAVSSPPGHSPRGLVRLSGPDTWPLVAGRLDDDLPLVRGLRATRFNLADLSLPALVLVMPGPHSYTGEDSVELQVAGHPLLQQQIITALLEDARDQGRNARLAEPGEFTARAFLNNRIDLLEAESVAARIAARSDDEIQAARMMQDGRLRVMVEEVSSQLIRLLALVEAGIDFTDEEDVVAISPRLLAEEVAAIQDRLQQHLDRSVGLEALQSVPWVVLDGPPNAGKSSLFNALLGQSRAIVSPHRGTTRDVISEPLRIEGEGSGEILLIDLAGEDHAQTAIDRAMQAAAAEARARAELQIMCVPPEGDPPVERSRTQPVLWVGTKGDLSGTYPVPVELRVSARTHHGLAELRHRMIDLLQRSRSSLAGDASVLAARQERHLQTAVASLDDAERRVDPGTRHVSEVELVAGSLREALDALGEIRGVVSPDDILDEVFSSFCIGK